MTKLTLSYPEPAFRSVVPRLRRSARGRVPISANTGISMFARSNSDPPIADRIGRTCAELCAWQFFRRNVASAKKCSLRLMLEKRVFV